MNTDFYFSSNHPSKLWNRICYALNPICFPCKRSRFPRSRFREKAGMEGAVLAGFSRFLTKAATFLKSAAFATILAIPCSAALVITEIMPGSAHSDSAINGDWWELTNTGSSAVDINGYSWDDDSNTPGTHSIGGSLIIQPGESIIFLDESSSNVASFKDAWGLSNIKVIPSNSSEYGDMGFSGLSQNGDTIYFYNAQNSLVDSAAYTTANSGVSIYWFRDGSPANGLLSQEGDFGAYRSGSTPADVASPGTSSVSPGATPPQFTSGIEYFGRRGLDAGLSAQKIRVTIASGPSASFSTDGAPAWLQVQSQEVNTAAFAGMIPLDAEDRYTFEVIATSGALQSRQEVILHTFNSTPRVIVNEYNAVDSGNYLNTEADGNGEPISPPNSDTFFGSVRGNGGDWFELVVIGDGTPGSAVDMRGWSIYVGDSSNALESIVLSNHSYWSNVIAGTILTFIEDDSARGGLDTSLNRNNQLSTEGYIWSNIWISDPVLIDQEASGYGFSIVVSHQNTRLQIVNQHGRIEYGPVGEDIAREFVDGTPETIGINATEVFKLAQASLTSPAPPDPYFSPYQDGSSSSFGAPNTWSGGDSSQDFSQFSVSDYRPSFSSTPVHYSNGANYTYNISANSAQGTVFFELAPGAPEWLSLQASGANSATLQNNRPLTLADAGEYAITIIATSNASPGKSTYQSWLLTIFNPQPTVLINEYNAVPGDGFLGGDAATSADFRFGRRSGNGGDWFEVVVVGDGGLSCVDMRGWIIELRNAQWGSFRPVSRIELSDHAFWECVPAGSILTFTEDRNAEGGWNTSLWAEDRSTTEGWVWSNIWVGDHQLIHYTNEESSGYSIDGLTASGIQIDSDNTQFRILDAAGRIVFGPVGEGFAPLAGISSIDTFELEGHPSPAIRADITADNDLSAPGYDNGRSDSTFGLPNRWNEGAGGDLLIQDFTPYLNPASATWSPAFPMTSDSGILHDPFAGIILEEAAPNWDYAQFGGWIHPASGSFSEGLFAYFPGSGWFWLQRAYYPYAWHFDTSQWTQF